MSRHEFSIRSVPMFSRKRQQGNGAGLIVAIVCLHDVDETEILGKVGEASRVDHFPCNSLSSDLFSCLRRRMLSRIPFAVASTIASSEAGSQKEEESILHTVPNREGLC